MLGEVSLRWEAVGDMTTAKFVTDQMVYVDSGVRVYV
jgi:hypothetical protein